MAELKPGLAGESSEMVTDQLTAAAHGSGLVPAFATPAMIALMENASVAAIQEYLGAGQTSVGIEVSIKHLAATPVGLRVRARSEVSAIDGRRVVFKVEAWDDKEKIGEGTHVRAIVDDARFMQRIAEKAKQ
ncbi:MAG: thioesterase family protein [Chloroflexota bacterium]|nr:thioesterase family protein [Chloroflexota bacterium]